MPTWIKVADWPTEKKGEVIAKTNYKRNILAEVLESGKVDWRNAKYKDEILEFLLDESTPSPEGHELSYPELVGTMTAIMREADKGFETSGGSTRHYIREQLLPLMERYGFKVVRASPTPTATQPGEGEFLKWLDEEIEFSLKHWQGRSKSDAHPRKVRAVVLQSVKEKYLQSLPAPKDDNSEMWHPQDYSGKNNPDNAVPKQVEQERSTEELITEMVVTVSVGTKDESRLIEEHMKEYFTKWHTYEGRFTSLEWYHIFLDFLEKVQENMIKPLQQQLSSCRKEIERQKSLVQSALSTIEDQRRHYKGLEGKLSSRQQERDAFRTACQNFVDKVNRGEARSKETFAEMSQLLEKYQ